jgi:hypothetical protein
MKIINKTLRCEICGCICLPDSRICPRCGKSFTMINKKKNIQANYLKLSEQENVDEWFKSNFLLSSSNSSDITINISVINYS